MDDVWSLTKDLSGTTTPAPFPPRPLTDYTSLAFRTDPAQTPFSRKGNSPKQEEFSVQGLSPQHQVELNESTGQESQSQLPVRASVLLSGAGMVSAAGASRGALGG